MTNDSDLSWKMSMLRTHGVTRDEERLQNECSGPWYYEQQDLGFNYRMSDIHAALGHSQLSRLEEFVEKRNILAQFYDSMLVDFPLKRPTIQQENRSSFHFHVIRLPTRNIPQKHRKVFEGLRSAGIGVNLHYMPVHLQPYYKKLGFAAGQFPEAEAYGNEAITLPLFTDLSDVQQKRVVKVLSDLL